MQTAEIELKFPIDDLARLQARLPALGFELDTPRTFESNVLYDTPARALREARQILRLRRYGDLWTVTHKRQPPAVADDVQARYKVRVETETRVDDGPALGAIFEQLGYKPVFSYEKYRTEWATTEGHLVLDETPIGVWAELEGRPEWIDRMLERLGVGTESCTTQSYGKLFLEWKERSGNPAENLTFEECGSLVKA